MGVTGLWTVLAPCARPTNISTLRSEEHTSELQSPCNLVCRLLLEKKTQAYTAAGTVSTRIESASFLLMPSRALHTWQIRLDWRATSLIFWSSQKPISRNRCVTSLEAESRLMHTTVPSATWLSGQTFGPAHSPSRIVYD